MIRSYRFARIALRIARATSAPSFRESIFSLQKCFRGLLLCEKVYRELGLASCESQRCVHTTDQRRFPCRVRSGQGNKIVKMRAVHLWGRWPRFLFAEVSRKFAKNTSYCGRKGCGNSAECLRNVCGKMFSFDPSLTPLPERPHK